MENSNQEEAEFTAADARRNYDAGQPPKVPSAEEIKMSPVLPAFKAAIIKRIKEVSHHVDSYSVTLPVPQSRSSHLNFGDDDFDSMMRSNFLCQHGIVQAPDKLTAADLTWLLQALGHELGSYPLDFNVRHVPSKGAGDGRIGGTVTYSAEYLHVSW